MYTVSDLDERFVIIKQATLKDATILDENYRHLISQTYNDDERQQYQVLRTQVRHRIAELQEGV